VRTFVGLLLLVTVQPNSFWVIVLDPLESSNSHVTFVRENVMFCTVSTIHKYILCLRQYSPYCHSVRNISQPGHLITIHHVVLDCTELPQHGKMRTLSVDKWKDATTWNSLLEDRILQQVLLVLNNISEDITTLQYLHSIAAYILHLGMCDH